jgi:hypothetical protein
LAPLDKLLEFAERGGCRFNYPFELVSGTCVVIVSETEASRTGVSFDGRKRLPDEVTQEGGAFGCADVGLCEEGADFV